MISLRRISSAVMTSIVIGFASPTGATVADDLEAAEAATPWVNDHGTEKRRLELPGGIIVEQKKHGDTIDSAAIDTGPGGAVRCLLLIYAAVLMEETLCPGSSPEWRAELVQAVDRLKEFASEHALTRDPPQTLSRAFDAEMATRQKKVEDLYPIGEKRRDLCEKLSSTGMNRAFRDHGIEALRKSIDKATATPRAAVMNPCL